MRVSRLIVAVLLGLLAPVAGAQEVYPSKPIQIIVPFAAGGGNDLLARIIADNLQKKWGQPVVVENKPGGGGNIGTEAMLRAPADGYTLLLGTNTMTIQAHLSKSVSFNVRNDCAPLAKVATTPFVLIVNPKIPATNLAELLRYLKDHPGTGYASVGVGTPHHLGMEWFKSANDLDMVHIPYRGTAPALADIIAGHVQLMFVTASAVLDLIKDKKLNVLGTVDSKRLASLPDVPTLTEGGVSGVEFGSWYGLMAKRGIPAPIQQKLTNALMEMVNERETRDRIVGAGFELAPSGPQETQSLLDVELDKWGEIIKRVGLKAD